MPKHRPGPDALDRDVDALLDRLLTELAAPADSLVLNVVRAAFRRKIPLHLRSYAAALLILEATSRGAARGPRANCAQRATSGRAAHGSDAPMREAPDQRTAAPRPRYQGDGTTVFFGLGKRQRLHPRTLLRLLTEEGGLAPEDIGDIRSFDNYSFVDIAPDKAEGIIAALSGKDFRGRALVVNKARKRGEAAPESAEEEANERRPGDTADTEA